MAESDKPDNVYEGLMTAPVELHEDKDPRTIGPNGKRPIETSPTSFALGAGHPA